MKINYESRSNCYLLFESILITFHQVCNSKQRATILYNRKSADTTNYIRIICSNFSMLTINQISYYQQVRSLILNLLVYPLKCASWCDRMILRLIFIPHSMQTDIPNFLYFHPISSILNHCNSLPSSPKSYYRKSEKVMLIKQPKMHRIGWKRRKSSGVRISRFHFLQSVCSAVSWSVTGVLLLEFVFHKGRWNTFCTVFRFVNRLQDFSNFFDVTEWLEVRWRV